MTNIMIFFLTKTDLINVSFFFFEGIDVSFYHSNINLKLNGVKPL